MARINIEDSLFKDDRWLHLVINTGCQYKALGLLSRAWILAQDHWIEYGFVPDKAWTKELNVLIEVELAEKFEHGVYVKGSKKAFAWLEQRVDAGRKGGLNKHQAEVKRSLAVAKQSPGLAKPLTLTLPLPLTLNTVVVEKKPNSALIQNAQFEPDTQKIRDFFGNNNLIHLKKHASQLFLHFGNYDAFADWIDGISDSAEKKTNNKAGAKRYIAAAILQELGLRQRKESGSENELR